MIKIFFKFFCFCFLISETLTSRGTKEKKWRGPSLTSKVLEPTLKLLWSNQYCIDRIRRKSSLEENREPVSRCKYLLYDRGGSSIQWDCSTNNAGLTGCPSVRKQS